MATYLLVERHTEFTRYMGCKGSLVRRSEAEMAKQSSQPDHEPFPVLASLAKVSSPDPGVPRRRFFR